jgi:hypothetical protein
LEGFDCTEDEYGQELIIITVNTYAVVKDGMVSKKRRMGWWGMSTDEVTRMSGIFN